MRKSRLVILPTKCLDRIGFLLLFLSCPVLGDWGRIQPESESSHEAIQISREGSCGLERDPPDGRFVPFREKCPVDGVASTDPMPASIGSLWNQQRSARMTARAKSAEERRSTDGNNLSNGRRTSLGGSRSSEREVRRRVEAGRSGASSPTRLNNKSRRFLSERRASDSIEHIRETSIRSSLAGRDVRKPSAKRETIEKPIQRQSKRRTAERSNRRLTIQRQDGRVRRGVDSEIRREQRDNLRRETRRIERGEREAGGRSDPRVLGKTIRKRGPISRMSKFLELPEVEEGNRISSRRDFISGEKVKRKTNAPEIPNPDRYSVERGRRNSTEGEDISTGFFDRILGSEICDGTKIGEWTLNCVIGAVAYYVNSKQTKSI